MEKKYELTDKTKVYDGCTLHRIRALKDFGDVKAGDLGGWIESEKNLSQRGDCWVSEEAKVYNNAKVHGNAKIYEEAEVYGNADVYGNAEVWGSAKVYGDAWVSGNAKVSWDIWIHEDAKVHGDVELDKSVGQLDICGNADISSMDQVKLPSKRRTLN